MIYRHMSGVLILLIWGQRGKHSFIKCKISGSTEALPLII